MEPSSIISTSDPTGVPTLVPTLSPVDGTKSPVVATPEPTDTPTVSPTVLATFGEGTFQVFGRMTLETMSSEMDRAMMSDWEVVTQQHILQVLRAHNFGDDPITEWTLAITMLSQDLLTFDQLNSETRLRHRKLQDAEALRVDFRARGTYSSTNLDRDIIPFLGLAFDGNDDIQQYSLSLGDENPAFQMVDSIMLSLGGDSPEDATPIEPDTSNDDGGTDIPILLIVIIVAAVAGVCIILWQIKGRILTTRTPRQPRTASELTLR